MSYNKFYGSMSAHSSMENSCTKMVVYVLNMFMYHSLYGDGCESLLRGLKGLRGSEEHWDPSSIDTCKSKPLTSQCH